MELEMSEKLIEQLKSSTVITRCPQNPVLKASDVPYKSHLVSNAGVTKYQGKYVMIFRNDERIDEYTVGEGLYLGIAYSDDGIKWNIMPKPCFDMKNDEFINTYDPRLIVIGGKCYMTFAMETQHGVRGGIAVTEDSENLKSFPFLLLIIEILFC